MSTSFTRIFQQTHLILLLWCLVPFALSIVVWSIPTYTYTHPDPAIHLSTVIVMMVHGNTITQ